jgi:hypothetical protein
LYNAHRLFMRVERTSSLTMVMSDEATGRGGSAAARVASAPVNATAPASSRALLMIECLGNPVLRAVLNGMWPIGE